MAAACTHPLTMDRFVDSLRTFAQVAASQQLLQRLVQQQRPLRDLLAARLRREIVLPPGQTLPPAATLRASAAPAAADFSALHQQVADWEQRHAPPTKRAKKAGTSAASAAAEGLVSVLDGFEAAVQRWHTLAADSPPPPRWFDEQLRSLGRCLL